MTTIDKDLTFFEQISTDFIFNLTVYIIEYLLTFFRRNMANFIFCFFLIEARAPIPKPHINDHI